jgi:thiamine-phosphate pyrophosphorylase
MATSTKPAPQRPAPRLYLVTPPLADAEEFLDRIKAALGAADIAAVLLRLQPAGERDLVNRVKSIAGIVQPEGAALVLDGQPEIAARAGADGAHLTGIDAFISAVEGLKPARIAGCGGLHTRHDAMLAGERGADYVMFGEPEPDGSRPSLASILERINWWAGLFEIPCVAFAESIDEVQPLAAAGADFIALGDSVWNRPEGPAAAVAEAAARLTMREPAQ